jgi:hypothetical protein
MEMVQQQPYSLALAQRLSGDEMDGHLHQGRVAELRRWCYLTTFV